MIEEELPDELENDLDDICLLYTSVHYAFFG